MPGPWARLKFAAPIVKIEVRDVMTWGPGASLRAFVRSRGKVEVGVQGRVQDFMAF